MRLVLCYTRWQKGGETIGKADKIIDMLEEMNVKLDGHSKVLADHSEILADHSKKHDNHTATLRENGQIWPALRTGQDHLKAEQEGMEIASAGEMSALREHMDKFMIHFDMLRDESWKNRADIQRLKNTLGMN